MNLPVASESVDAATIAFGIRNVQRPEVACRGALQGRSGPGGRLAILEFGTPQSRGVRSHLSLVFAQHPAARSAVPSRATTPHTRYLPESIGAFAYGDEFDGILRAAGFSQVQARPLMFGAVYLYTGQKDCRGLGT